MSTNIRELSHKWNSTDSISEKEELAETIIAIGSAFIKNKYQLYEKFGICTDGWIDSSYRSDRGSLYEIYDVDDNEITIKYSDYCRGRDYNCHAHINFNEIENFNEAELINSLRTLAINKCEGAISYKKDEIKKLKDKIEALKVL